MNLGTVSASGSVVVFFLASLSPLAGCSKSGGDHGAGSPLAVVTQSLPDAMEGSPYLANLTATGGLPPYTWTISAGALPMGLVLDPGGDITGSPLANGPFSFTVQVADSLSPPGTATALLGITVQPALTVTTTSLPDATQGSPYSYTLVASGGLPPYTWSLASGALPNGVGIDTAGVISGTPTERGLFGVTVEVTDSQPSPATEIAPLTLLVLGSGGGNTPPDVTLCPITGPQRGLVDLCYTLTDQDGDRVMLLVEYSDDSGATFQVAAPGPGGEGTGPVQGDPVASNHLFVWDSRVDIPPVFAVMARLRLTPFDSQAGPVVETADFPLDNSQGREIFVPSQRLQVARMDHTATQLMDGSVFVAGGTGAGQVILASAEVFSPVTGLFALLGPTMTTPRTKHTASLLPDGTVLLAGGIPGILAVELDSAEIFDPALGTFQAVGSMTRRRVGHAAAESASEAYVTGGLYSDPNPVYLNEAETYDPIGLGFGAPPGTLSEARENHTATVLSNGRILLVGGSGSWDLSAEEFDPGSGSSPVTNFLMGDVEIRWHATSLLPDGTALVTGGGAGRGVSSIANSYPTTFIYTSPTGLVSGGLMNDARRYHTSNLLPDGRVLVAGGEENMTFMPLPSAEVYDTASPGFTRTGSMNVPRMRHAAVLLDDGRLLLTGGTSDGTDPVAETERYHR